MRRSWMTVLLLLATAVSAVAQSWSAAYDTALGATRGGNWTQAREAFKQAIAYRPEDVSGPTSLPGPISEQRRWRNGAPYSPNFLAAYSGFKAAQSLAGDDRTNLLREVGNELQAILDKGQHSPEAFFFANATFVTLGDTEKRLKLEEKLRGLNGKLGWKVDTEGITPQDQASVAQSMRQQSPVVNTGTGAGSQTTTGSGGTGTGTAGTGTTGTGQTGTGTAGTGTVPPLIGQGRVTAVPDKYALIIGNSMSSIEGREMPFGSEDAQLIRETLLMSAGYLEENIDVVLNATAEQIRASVAAMAERVPQDSTLMLFFAGVGVNVAGKDYLAGVDSSSLTETSTMVAKSEVYQAFLLKGVKIFAFFESDRTIVSGRYFGSEVPMMGRVAQVQATMPGQKVYSLIEAGKNTGLFAAAIAGVLNKSKANRIPIHEFGWQVYYFMKGGATGQMGGGTNQTPTLPVLINLSTDAVF